MKFSNISHFELRDLTIFLYFYFVENVPEGAKWKRFSSFYTLSVLLPSSCIFYVCFTCVNSWFHVILWNALDISIDNELFILWVSKFCEYSSDYISFELSFSFQISFILVFCSFFSILVSILFPFMISTSIITIRVLV